MDWQATDQFGNLYFAESTSNSVGDLSLDLESMLEELADRGNAMIVLTCDLDSAEIVGPHPDSVTHILHVDWLRGMGEPEVAELVRQAATQAAELVGMSAPEISVRS